MSFPERVIASQSLSSAAYQWLRDKLVQQRSFFDQTLTEKDHSFVKNSQEAGSKEPSDIDFVMMRSPLLSVLLTATPAASPDTERHQVTLTFDPVTIEQFSTQLNRNQRNHSANAAAQLPLQTALEINKSLDVRVATAEADVDHRFFHPEKLQDTAEASQIKNELILAWQHVLANDWSLGKNQLTVKANSLGAVDDITDDVEVRQSLLLSDVLTSIRNSLDLPDILKTTVDRVREFLGTDRLVIYQFESDQFDPNTEPSDRQERHQSVPLTDILNQPSNVAADYRMYHHSGQVTYESRCCDEVSSVLHYSEAVCFQNDPEWRSRYLKGVPIAVNDVAQQYRDQRCLLDFLTKAQVKSKLIAPIIVDQQLWGLLIAHQCQTNRHWQSTELAFLCKIAEHLAVAIRQSILYQRVQKQAASLEQRVAERTQNLQDALYAAELANLSKGEFLSTMSHELRTPLTYIIGMSSTLLRWSFGELSERQRSYLKTINHSGEQLLEMINSILDFARIESGRQLLSVAPLSVTPFVESIIESNRTFADSRQITLSAHIEDSVETAPVHADAKRLGQVLFNLVNNGIKFTPAEGEVSLRVSADGDHIYFQVSDTGIGISDPQKSQLFETFKQLESPYQRQYSGAGLGLAIAKRLIDLHGGTIHVRSEVDQGSTFTVQLPKQSPSDINPKRIQSLSKTQRPIILLETEENSAAIVCDLLMADGYQVIWLVEHKHLLDQLAGTKPAVMIADLTLMSQEENEIKAVELAMADYGTKILALLNHSTEQPSHIAHHDTLEKPIDPKILLKKVRQLTVTSQRTL